MQPSLATIVLLEDDPNDVLFVRRALAKAHIINPIRIFPTAEQARRYLQSRPEAPPALFILDMMLPGGETGIAFLGWLRRQRVPLGSTTTILLTGSQRRDHHDEAQMLGSIYVLHKPVTEEILLEAVQSLGLAVTSLPGVTTGRAVERQLQG